MDDEQVKQIVENFRQEVYYIYDDEVKAVLELCKRKMELSNKPDSYLYLLLPDELKNYFVRLVISEYGMQGKTVKEILEQCREMLAAE